jgi:hypothetical protein
MTKSLPRMTASWATRQAAGAGMKVSLRVVGLNRSRQERPMTEKAISPLRRRLIEDMTIRRLDPKTRQQYINEMWPTIIDDSE